MQTDSARFALSRLNCAFNREQKIKPEAVAVSAACITLPPSPPSLPSFLPHPKKRADSCKLLVMPSHWRFVGAWDRDFEGQAEQVPLLPFRDIRVLSGSRSKNCKATGKGSCPPNAPPTTHTQSSVALLASTATIQPLLGPAQAAKMRPPTPRVPGPGADCALSACLPACLPALLAVCLVHCPSVCMSVRMYVCMQCVQNIREQERSF